MAEEKKYLTRVGYDKLVEELNNLKNEKLPEVLNRLKDAVAQGDISENAEYETAMSEKDLIEVRINEIEQHLENVEIIEEGESKGEIQYGSRVVLKEGNEKIHEFTLVGSGELDILRGSISFDSPVGQAIYGKKPGDVVTVKAPKGRYSLEIIDVK